MKKLLIISSKCLVWFFLLALFSSVILVLFLRWVDPPGSAVIWAWELREEKTANRKWVTLAEISPWLQISVIASEDQKFPGHFGFDVEAIKQSLTENRRRPRGASTISQQVAKNLFLWNGRSYVRKAIEVWLTLLMEVMLSKERILEIYLNIAEFGLGVYGAEAASQQYFFVPASKLNSRQAALLAAVLPSPKRMFASNPSKYVQARAKVIQKMSKQLGNMEYLRNM